MASTTVNFNLKTAGYVNYANQTLTFTLLNAGAEASTGDQSYVTLPGTVTATSAANGDGSVSLFRNGKSGIDSVYEVVFPNRERAKFIIPAGSSTIELAALLVDNVPNGAATQQSSVYAAAIQRANHTGTQALSTISDASTVQLKPSEGAFVNGDKTKLDNIAGSTTEQIQDIAGPLVATGGTKTGIAVTYDDANNNMDFVVASQTDQNFTTADHSKLDGIEASATADQTAAEIRTLVESATDSNVFTDADHTKLNNEVNFVPRSISFTNTSAYLSLADNAALDVDAGDFSLSFWARLDSSGTEPVLTKLSGTGYRLKFASGSLILTMQDAGGSADFTLATGLNDNKWHVYVVTVDRSGNAIAYVDNVAQTGVGVSGTALTLANSGQFQIGSDGGSNAGDGIALGNYIVLHKAILSASQAAQIYFSADAALTAVAPTLMVDLRKADKTFTDVGTHQLGVTTNGTIIFNESRVTSLNETTIGATTPASVTGTAVLATLSMGYGASSGGTTTQPATSGKATATNAINKSCGEIVMDNAALAANTTVSFTLTNNTIGPTSVVIVNHASVGTAGAYQVTVGAVGLGTCLISVRNVTGGSLSQAIKLNFAVLQASHS